MVNSSFLADSQFGPAVAPYRSLFDFTEYFEDAILSIAPSIVFLLVFPLRVAWLYRKPRTVAGSLLHSNKLIILSIFAALQVVCLGIWAAPSTPKSPASVAAACLTVADAISLVILSHTEHLRSVRPSDIINSYILLSLLFDIARARTLWIRGDSNSLAAAFSATISIKLFVLVVEAFEKRDILLSRYQHYPPESTSGIYSRSFFWWLNPLLRDGFKKVLTDDDLYPIDDTMKARIVHKQFQDEWAKEKTKNRPNALLQRTLWSVRGELASAIFPRLCVTFFNYMQPFLINSVINFIVQPESELASDIGWGLTAAYGIDLLGYAIANGAYYHQTYRMVTTVRGAIVSAIYSQTVNLNLTSVDESAALTLMATDVDRICNALGSIHMLWASMIEIAIGIWLLERQIGIATLGPVFLSILCGGVTVRMARKYMASAQLLWVQKIQTRIDATSKMLGGMKAVKMLGLTRKMHEIAQSLRVEEVEKSLFFRKLLVLRIVLGKGSEVFSPGVAFAAFVAVSSISDRTLDVAQAYSSLSIITLLAVPLAQTIQTLPQFIAAVSCFDRIQAFLALPSQRDHRFEISSSDRGFSNFPEVSKGTAMGNVELTTIPRPAVDENSVIKALHTTFAWNQQDPVITDASFDIRRGSLTFIIGPVGSGKSTLLKGLMGETLLLEGFVHTSKRDVAFVDQTSWIQNASLQSNILGLSAYNQPWYAAVIHACNLQDDFQQLRKGDQTVVGSAGISLSGGQKQRVALARAVYSRKDLIILDDCFSGLDATSEERIFNRLFSKTGLLRKRGSTVLLVTHAAQRLKYADHIIVLGSRGQIAEQGTLSNLSKHGKYVPGINARLIGDIGIVEEKTEVAQTFGKPTKELDIELATADINRQVGDLSTYLYYVRAAGWSNTILFVAYVTVFGIFSKLPDFWITFWTQALAIHGNSVNGFYLSIFILFEVIAVITLGLACYQGYISMTARSAKSLHKTILDTVMNASLLFFTSTDTGTIVNRFSQDMTLVDIDLPDAYIELAASTVFGIVEAVLMCFSSGYFAASMPFVLLVMYVLQLYYLRTSRQLRLLDLEAKSPLYSHFMETLEGLVTIRAFGWTEDFEAMNAQLLDASQKPFYLLFCIQRWLGLVLDLTVAALAVVLMILVVKLRGTINPGYVGLALVNVNAFNLSLSEIIKSWTLLETSMGAITRVKTFAANTESENLAAEIQTLQDEWPRKGKIEIKELEACYKPGFPIIHNLSLSIGAGEKIGLCGSSGSGKSSIIASLFRMLEFTHGSVLVDDIDLSLVQRSEIRLHVNAIPQDPYFFKGSVRLNADPLGRITDAAIEAALRKVDIWSIIDSKGGLDTPADADMFSHGQRQLFCLARSILHPSKIVVLDEVTSSVDFKTDELMQRIIREEFSQCTIIAVAHRLDTIMDFDRIAVLDSGKLVEFDTPSRLMRHNSAFKKLYDGH